MRLAFSFSKKFKVIGFETNKEKVVKLNNGEIYIKSLEKKKINHDNFKITYNFNNIKRCNFIIICFPTPSKPDKTPDLSFVKESARLIGKNLKKNQFVILESTTYPGTTKEILIPILEEENGLKIGKDFGIAYSPERVDPGNKKFGIENTPKVVGSINSEFCETAAFLYGPIVKRIVKVSNCETAEAVKMLENVFRNVDIALINELAIIFEKMEINIWETIEASKTKPYEFMPFYPGPGVGGHCIPLDSYYISYRAKQFGLIPRFIKTVGEINDFMTIHMINLAEKGLKKINKILKNSKIAILELAYKPDIDDTRKSPAIRIIEELIERNTEIKVYDPHVKSVRTNFGEFYSEENIEGILKWAEYIIFVTSYSVFKENIGKYLTILDNKTKETIIINGVNI